MGAQETDLDIHLFTKKDDGEGFNFYYIGTTSVATNSPKEEVMYDKTGKQIPVVTRNMVLEHPVQYDIYHYLEEEEEEEFKGVSSTEVLLRRYFFHKVIILVSHLKYIST